MKLHTNLTEQQVRAALIRAKDKGLIARDIRFAVFTPGRSLTHAHGLRVTVQFRGDSPHAQPDTYVLSWHGVEPGWRLSPDEFSNVNRYHGHKATDIVRGFEALLNLLRWRFAAITDGSAFIPALTEGSTS